MKLPLFYTSQVTLKSFWHYLPGAYGKKGERKGEATTFCLVKSWTGGSLLWQKTLNLRDPSAQGQPHGRAPLRRAVEHGRQAPSVPEIP
jgi:hypothetical protein